MFVWGFNKVSFEISTVLRRMFGFNRMNRNGLNIWLSKHDRKKEIFLFALVAKMEMFIQGFNKISPFCYPETAGISNLILRVARKV
jgi:hypothetical protein